MHAKPTLAVFFLLVLLLVSRQNAAALRYQVHDLGLLPGTPTTWAEDINEAGVVVGWAGYSNGPRYPVIWEAGNAVSRIGSLSSNSNAMANGINNSGQVAIYCDGHAYEWSEANGVTQIGLSWASDINELGQIAGVYGGNAAILNPDGTRTDIPGMTRAWAINDHGAIAGTIGDIYDHPAKWSPECGLTALPALSTYLSGAFGVNNLGQVCGNSFSTDGVQYAVVWEPDCTLRKLATLANQSVATAWDINNAGIAVGSATDRPTGLRVPAAWTPDAALFTLDILSGYDGGEAQAVNDQGEIVGYCSSSLDHTSRAVLWEPVPEPSSVLMLLFGLTGFVANLIPRR